MSGGSAQLRRFRIAARAGDPIEVAAVTAGLSLGEARLVAADDARRPPPEDAYQPLGTGFCAGCARDVCECSDLTWAGWA